MFDLQGKKALVTGASGGIGAHIAKTLSQQGAIVALSGTRVDKLTSVAESLGNGAPVLPCDLSDPDAVSQLVKQAEEALGGLDILVNNAGITRDGLAMRMKDEDWEAVINVNLTATFCLIRNSLKNMMKQRKGRIINITSVVGVTGNPGQANYCAAKAGMIGLTKSLAAEVASRNITVNCVAPGFIATPMTEKLNDAQKASINEKIPAGRMGTPSDIAAAVAFVASDQASYITGQTIHVNGGMAMI